MIHGYHVILPMYGFWLPNDPRGSWSDFVRRWELVRFGKSQKGIERKQQEDLSPAENERRANARNSLMYPAVTLNGHQALKIAKGFATRVSRSCYTIWGCTILPEHTHLVIARHRFKVEHIVNQLKGAATRQLMLDGCHPLTGYAEPGRRPPRMWASHEWKVYLDSEQSVEAAIHYVEENPAKEGKPKQCWSFVTPFAGLSRSGWTTYH